jgi:hypothetical protein
MVSYIRDGIHSIHNFAAKNVFNTPQRIVAGHVAAGVAAAGSVALGAYTGLLYSNGELSKNVGTSCAAPILRTIAMLPESMQFVDANTVLKRIEHIPVFNESCALSVACMLGRIGKYVAWFIPTKYLVEKMVGYTPKQFANKIECDTKRGILYTLNMITIRDEILQHRPKDQQQLAAILRRASLTATYTLGELITTLQKTKATKDYDWVMDRLLNPNLQTRKTPLQIDYAKHCDQIFGH